jgi:hypothetical protein
VAFATLFSQFIFTTSLIFYAYRNYTKNITEHLRLILGLYGPLFWVLAMLWLLGVFSYVSRSFQEDIFISVLKCIILLFSCTPFIIYAFRQKRLLLESVNLKEK